MKQININLLGDAAVRPLPLGLPAGTDLDPTLILMVVVGLVMAFGVPAFSQWVIDKWLIAPADQRIADQKLEIKKNRSGSIELKRLDQEVTDREKDLRELQGLVGKGGPWADILGELRNLTPTDLWLTGFSMDGQRVNLSGEALDYKSVAYFYTNLQNSRYFAGPVLDKIEMEGAGGADPTVRFALKATVIAARSAGQ